MSLLAASPFLSGLFLTYANRAATIDVPPTPSPTDQEWMEMKALNNRLREEIALLRDQSTKETDRARAAEGYVEALRAQLSSVKDTNRDLEAAVSDERAKFEAITLEYADYKKETAGTIAELQSSVDKEAGARTALSQIIAEQQVTLASLKEKNEPPPLPPVVTPQHQGLVGGGVRESWRRSSASTSERDGETARPIDTRKPRDDSGRSFKNTKLQGDSKWKDSADNMHTDDKNRKDDLGNPNNSIKLGQDGKQEQEKEDLWGTPRGHIWEPPKNKSESQT